MKAYEVYTRVDSNPSDTPGLNGETTVGIGSNGEFADLVAQGYGEAPPPPPGLFAKQR
jgi:hypothetical protein